MAHEGVTIAGEGAAHEDATGTLEQRREGLEAPKIAHEGVAIAGEGAAHEDATGTLEQRVEELEKGKITQEDATRTIIRQSFAEMGSNINEYVAFGGTLEALTFRTEDFGGGRESNILLDTAEIDFEIQASDWVLGSLVFQYDQGTDVLFPTTEGDESGVDRVNVRQAWLTIGNTQNFPFFGTFGRDVVPFGISTGDPVVDVLTLIDPLTVEAFEAREDFLMFGFELPTPPPPLPLPTTPGLGPPPVRPLLIKPLVRKVGTWLCSSLPCYVPPPKAAPAAIPQAPRPPFTGSVYFYNGDTFDGGGNHIEHVGGTVGYRTKGMFSRRRIPWSIDIDGDVNSSVFDSDFLAFEYRGFLDQIGYVPGMAGHIKSNLGPTALVLEWNGAINKARFTDDLGRAFSIRPSGWQAQLAYQFDFKPSVEAIGAQGTYVVIAYSESEDLAGVRRLIADTPTRVGFVPRRRLSVGIGEWVLDSLRVAVEYSYSVDYSIAEGGTGNSADGMFTQLTYQW